MEGRLFTFLGTIGGHGQEWIILSHFVLVIGIIFLVKQKKIFSEMLIQ
mgnify:CR=1 FL=1